MHWWEALLTDGLQPYLQIYKNMRDVGSLTVRDWMNQNYRGSRTNPVWIAGAAENMSHSNIMEMEDFTSTSAFASSKTAYEMAGLGPKDMEMAMIYDSFTVTAAMTAEMLGLAPRGRGRLRRGDLLPHPQGVHGLLDLLEGRF